MGSRSGRPRLPIDPDQAWRVNSVAGLPTHGPSHPNGLMVTITSDGFAAHSAAVSAGPSTTTTSAAAASAAGSRVSTTDRFEALRYSNRAPDRQARSESPSGGSTL